MKKEPITPAPSETPTAITNLKKLFNFIALLYCVNSTMREGAHAP